LTAFGILPDMPLKLRRWVSAALVFVMAFMGVGAVAFPQTPLEVDVELYYDSTWNNIDADTYHRDGSPIVIARGRTAEGKRCDPGKLMLQLNNRDGKYSPRNPNSPLYSKIGRNTPIRVKVTYNSVTYVRFVGEVTSWPSRWDVSQKDIWVPIEAAGILRRLGQGSKPLQSPLYRTMIGAASGDVVPAEYWALEDGPNATQFASAVGGTAGTGAIGNPPAGVDPPEPAGHSGIPGSSTSVLLPSNALMYFPVRAYTDTGQWVIQHAFVLDTDDAGFELEAVLNSGLKISATVDTATDSLEIVVEDASSVVHFDATSLTGTVIEEPLSMVLAFTEAGGSDELVVRVLDGDGETRAQLSTTAVSYSTVKQVNFDNGPGDTVGVSHLALFTDPTFDPDVDTIEGARAVSGWDAEPAAERFARLCDQIQIASAVIGNSSGLMGPERTVSRIQAFRDTEDVDQGFLFELREQIGLQFRTNSSRYNQTPTIWDYGEGHISPPFDPEPDDQQVANDREVKRRNGSSARRELTAGPLSVQDPPDGVGRYDDSITIDCFGDDQLEHIAGWRLHVGTWDSERYPRVRVDLAANPDLIATVATLDSGDYVQITSLPSWLPPEDAELLVEGYAERLGFYDWDVVFCMSPAGPYQVVGRWGLLSHELHTAVNTSATSVDIANTSTAQPMLATTAADVGSGYGLTIGGEEMLLTAVTASTVTFGNTGTASTGGSGSRTPGLPTGSALGNLVLIYASTRNSGTGVPDTPSDWLRLPIFPSNANCQVFGRIYDGVWSMPTVTFTGGAANEDTIAQSMRLGGKWHSVANILVGSASCLNASAANITYPGLAKPVCDNGIVLFFAWKQDDYTSITGPGTEIQEASSTAGNDASQSWAYTIQTTAASVASGAFTPTGGASAISRGAVAVLRCDYQTATVTRSTNGISASHSAGDAVTMTKPMRWGLVV
jgi:hypothetical protein